jgi:surfeit locus 1 family protein
MKRSVWPVVVAAIAAIAILLGLGAWQLMRLTWKQNLIAQIASKAEAAPVSLADAFSAEEAGGDIEFLKVEATGQFIEGEPLMMIATQDGGPGWRAISALLGDGGIFVLVDRGILPDSMKQQVLANSPKGPVLLRGILRRHEGAQGIFDPENDAVGNLWFWWDLPAMQAASKVPPDARVAPFVLQLTESMTPDEFPKPQPPDAGLRNNHLQYAITWFSLALVAAVIAVLVIRRRNIQ